MNRATVCIFLATILPWNAPAFAQGILSDAVGLGALTKIIQDKDLQDEFEISPRQLDSLVKLLNSQEVAEGLQRDPFKSEGMMIDGVSDEDFGGPQFSSKKLKDEIVAQELAKLLEPSQLAAIRVTALRNRVRFPLDALSIGFLVQVGLTNAEIHAVRAEILESIGKATSQLHELRTTAVVAITGVFPNESRKKFVQCFGRDYLPSSSTSYNFDISSFGLFKVDHGQEALAVALFLFNPNSSLALTGVDSLTDQQFLKFDKFMKELNSKILNEPTSSVEKAADEALKSILTDAQRSALVHYQHRYMLETDLTNIMKQQLVGFLQLPLDLQPGVSAECRKWQDKIDALRLKLEIEDFKTVVSESPKNTRSILTELYDQVWCGLK